MVDEQPRDLTTRILVEIRDELRGQRSLIASHGDLLGQHEVRLGRIETAVVEQGVTLRQILRAIEHGSAIRAERLDDHERRIARLEERTE